LHTTYHVHDLGRGYELRLVLVISTVKLALGTSRGARLVTPIWTIAEVVVDEDRGNLSGFVLAFEYI
jgi:hypothetical protein